MTNGSCQINKDPVLSGIIILSLLYSVFFFISFYLCLESPEQLDFLFLQCRKVSTNCIFPIIEHIDPFLPIYSTSTFNLPHITSKFWYIRLFVLVNMYEQCPVWNLEVRYSY